MSLNPFCEIAVEEALRLRQLGVATEVVAVTVGPAAWEPTLRTALAMGADRGVHVVAGEGLEPLAVAKLLRKVVGIEEAGMVMLGKQVGCVGRIVHLSVFVYVYVYVCVCVCIYLFLVHLVPFFIAHMSCKRLYKRLMVVKSRHDSTLL